MGNFFVNDHKKAERRTPYCEFCLACAHSCPQKAITLSVQDNNPEARWRHPDVKLPDLVRANKVV